jgi:hypothetical protein
MPFRDQVSTSDRRVAQRQTVAYRLDVVTREGEVGCLLDLSLTGMRVRFKGTLDAGRTNQLTLEFPRWLELGEGLTLGGRFAWMKQREAGVQEFGFAFDGIGRKEQGVLAVLIQRLAEAQAEDLA